MHPILTQKKKLSIKVWREKKELELAVKTCKTVTEHPKPAHRRAATATSALLYANKPGLLRMSFTTATVCISEG